jgi:hypothetical protein
VVVWGSTYFELFGKSVPPKMVIGGGGPEVPGVPEKVTS